MDGYTEDRLRAQRINDAKIRARDLSGLDISGKNLAGCDLRGYLLARANFERTILAGADLRGQCFTEVNCVNASFVGADLRAADLAYGFFHGADFRAADLRGSRIAGAVINAANFAVADLRGAELGTGHYDSDFRGADLRGIVMPPEGDFRKLNCRIDGNGPAEIPAAPAPKKAIPGHNRRRHERVCTAPPMKCTDSEGVRQLGSIVDISKSGFRLASRDQLASGSIIDMMVHLPDGSPLGNTVDVKAEVVWSRRRDGSSLHEAGMRILSISEADKAVVDALIDINRTFNI